jgi:hypothetical protein
MSKTAAISVRVSPEVKAAAEREAAADHRTLASLVEKILVEWLRNQGALNVVRDQEYSHQLPKPVRVSPRRGARRRV